MTIDVRARRAAAAARWRPDPVRLLLIAEAPPSAPDRYFYFEHVIAQDSLFRYVAQGVLGTVPPRAAKGKALAGLRARGVFLIDVSPGPVGSHPDLSPLVPDLTARVTALDPGHVVLIKTNVYDVAYEPLRAAGLSVSGHRLPFPGSGQQRRFADGFAAALADIRWRGRSAPTTL